ncbi:MAG: hypothetical protein FJ301_02095 [Planctomycetes bacterium]|nr:hypothetical protein [Planctomycetota bacterium]
MSVLGSLFRAFGDLLASRVAGIVGACVALGVACFAGVWWGLDAMLVGWFGYSAETAPWWLAWLGGSAVVLLAWFTFPMVAGAFVGLFLERIARVVEARHYPGLPPAKGLPFGAALRAGVRFLLLVVAINVALLVFGLLPALYPFAWLLGNGWLLGREHFELVALRRLDAAAARALRRRHRVALLFGGCALAGLSLVPLLNFVAPVLGVAFFVHRAAAWSTPARG